MEETILVKKQRDILWLDSDISYTRDRGWRGHIQRDLKLSVLRHAEPGTAPRPALLWLCGGYWMEMDHNIHLSNLTPLADRGYVIVSPDYRTDRFAGWREQLRDVKAAIRWLRAHAAQYDVDPNRIGIFGESAGGHLASLAALTAGLPAFCTETQDWSQQSDAVQAACPWYGPADLAAIPVAPPLAAMLSAWLGVDTPEEIPQAAAAASPITYVTPQAPPFLLLHGTADTLVPPAQSRALYNRLCAAHVPAQLCLLEGAGHATWHFYQKPVLTRIADFFDEHM